MARRAHTVTIVDVAREAGVSKSSAARVLAGRGSASPATQQRVQDAAERLGYRPNALAKAMISGTSNTLAIVIPDVASPFFSAVVRGASDAAHAAGFEVLLGNTDNDRDIQARAIDVLREKQVDGFIVAPVFEDDPGSVRALVDDDIPVVLLDRRMPALADVPLVSVDHIAASRAAVEHLIELGHHDIAIVTEAAGSLDELRGGTDDAHTLRPSHQRLLGYLDALQAHGIPVDPALVLSSAYDADSARAAVAEALQSRRFTALYCTDSVLTLGAYTHIVDSDLSLPGAFSFVGFDDQEWTTLVRPAVTVVDQPRYRLGAATANMLIARIRRIGEVPSDMLLDAQLITRASTSRPV
ncbi:LacI family DNA-binding transcriptional regulator [Microbacterium marinilacus]|uniref:LacI family DNA-binding transcriptional regulator n=1 Tax=Microbacterium marinilacus TaxID=415209 RepID=A0ABP7BQT5_9MICO|nr:LacI family DNA-binding transcriptional regulator [Microbacterium marinilacus]MBY0689241.1 LacI family transcriptional regulator [Microbacterium marinilacus]